MSAKIIKFQPKLEVNQITDLVLKQQAEISCADDVPVRLDMSSDVRDVFESLAEVLELNTRYIHEKFCPNYQETQTLIQSYTRIIARLRLLIP